MAKYATVRRSTGTALRWFAQELGSIGGDSLGFHNVLFPVGTQYGSSGGPGFNTTIVDLDSGAEERVSRWPKAKHTYNAVHNVKSRADLQTILTFFDMRDGAANGFRFRDFSDETTASDHKSPPSKDDVIIGYGDGETKIFQLRKSYSSGNQQKYRAILLPVTPAWGGTTFVCLDGGTALTYGTDYTINDTTGQLILTSAPALGVVITAGFYFHVPVRFGASADRGLMLSIDSFDTGSVPEIELVELLDNILLPEDGNPGWASEITGSADVMITPNMGNAIRFGTSANIIAYITSASELQLGANWFILWNNTAFTVELLEPNGDDIDGGTTLAAGAIKRLHIFPVNGINTWKVSA